MTITAYGIDTDENVAISGMQKLEYHENVEINPEHPEEDGGVQEPLLQNTRTSMKEKQK